jgi:hypothetical protein
MVEEITVNFSSFSYDLMASLLTFRMATYYKTILTRVREYASDKETSKSLTKIVPK